eukprot:1367131-Heterocapsa_arctica.AAC.1
MREETDQLETQIHHAAWESSLDNWRGLEHDTRNMRHRGHEQLGCLLRSYRRNMQYRKHAKLVHGQWRTSKTAETTVDKDTQLYSHYP